MPTKTIIKYGELIEEATGGAVKCDVQYGCTLGTMPRRSSPPCMGTIDLKVLRQVLPALLPSTKAKVMDLPFLFTSAEEANEVLDSRHW